MNDNNGYRIEMFFDDGNWEYIYVPNKAAADCIFDGVVCGMRDCEGNIINAVEIYDDMFDTRIKSYRV